MTTDQKRAYAIDAMASTITSISNESPFFFQRDGSFYVVSTCGYGKLSYGLSIRPENPDKHSWKRELPEIIDSDNIIIQMSKNSHEDANEKTQFKNGEKPYVAPLIFNRDSNGHSSLEEMANIAKSLKVLPDDGKIRLVSHSQLYHSHKYGYACDGTDTWLDDARVMNRDRYFELIRVIEDKFFETLLDRNEKAIVRAYAESNVSFSDGRPIKIPDTFIITPNIMLTFPRFGALDFHNPLTTWMADSDLSECPVYNRINQIERSPFAFYCMINRKMIEAQTANSFEEGMSQSIKSISDDLAGANTAMPLIESFLEKINEAHNRTNKKRN